MPGDGEDGDAIIFSPELPAQDWDHHKSWYDAWQCLGGNANPGDTIELQANHHTLALLASRRLPPMRLAH